MSCACIFYLCFNYWTILFSQNNLESEREIGFNHEKKKCFAYTQVTLPHFIIIIIVIFFLINFHINLSEDNDRAVRVQKVQQKVQRVGQTIYNLAGVLRELGFGTQYRSVGVCYPSAAVLYGASIDRVACALRPQRDESTVRSAVSQQRIVNKQWLSNMTSE